MLDNADCGVLGIRITLVRLSSGPISDSNGDNLKGPYWKGRCGIGAVMGGLGKLGQLFERARGALGAGIEVKELAA